VVVVVTSSHTYQLVAPKDQFGGAYKDRTPLAAALLCSVVSVKASVSCHFNYLQILILMMPTS